MSAALHKHWHRQDGKCFYCEGDTWMRGFGVDGAALALRRATATLEHLVRKADGGKGGANLVMACARCNVTRGTATVEDHKAAMMDLVAQGKHPVNRRPVERERVAA
jgi:5-methylcytosine-specific restriction endonuclease McrA